MIIDRFFEKISSRYPVANLTCQVTKTQPLRITVFDGRYMIKVGKSFAYLSAIEVSNFVKNLENVKNGYAPHIETDRYIIDELQLGELTVLIDKIVFTADAEELVYSLKSIAVAGGAL